MNFISLYFSHFSVESISRHFINWWIIKRWISPPIMLHVMLWFLPTYRKAIGFWYILYNLPLNWFVLEGWLLIFSVDSFDSPRYMIMSAVNSEGFEVFLLHLVQEVLVDPTRRGWVSLVKVRVTNFMSMSLVYTLCSLFDKPLHLVSCYFHWNLCIS